MSKRPVAIVVPAGQGSWKQSDLPQVLRRLSGVALVGHALAMARTLESGHGGERTTIGAGTVTCNHGGVMTHRNETGCPDFIGSDSILGDHGTGEMFIGSEAVALASFTCRITHLEDGDHALRKGDYRHCTAKAIAGSRR